MKGRPANILVYLACLLYRNTPQQYAIFMEFKLRLYGNPSAYTGCFGSKRMMSVTVSYILNNILDYVFSDRTPFL